MHVVVYSQYLKEGDLPFVQYLFDALAANGVTAYVNMPYLQELQGKITFQSKVHSFDNHLDFQSKAFDFVITLGGDGTILAAAMLVRDSGVPILGINLGRLGFLATVSKDEIAAAIGLLAKGGYTVGERSTLHLESDPPLFGDTPYALNDFTILKRDTSSMITIHAFVNGAYLNTYWADGLVVATPTGSTGYSLSCGGPIVFPDSNNFVLTPVAPHNLNVRPLVIADSATISFEVEGRTDNFLCTLDSRHEIITSDNKIAVRKGNFPVKVVQLLDDSFLDTMRKKLNWGVDLRNH